MEPATRTPFESITRDDEPSLRGYGVYTQRPAADGFFMDRLRITGGDLTPDQLRAVADLANVHGRGLADITVRQNIQLHWVRFESLPEIMTTLESCGLATIESSGAPVRNLLNCPVSGVDEAELYDTSLLIRQVNDYFAAVTNLDGIPRKLKISITGCALRCTYPEVNDIGIFAVRDLEDGGVLFRARVGGGLSAAPRFSRDLGILAQHGDVVELCGAIAAVFRDRAMRENEDRTRVHFRIGDDEIPRFRELVEARLGRKLRRASEPDAPAVAERDRSHLGINPQRQKGLHYIGIALVGGRTSGDELNLLASIAQEHRGMRVRTTNSQNIMLLNVPEANLAAVTSELEEAGFDYRPAWARKGIIACTGIQFCKLAVAETKNRAVELTDYLAKEVKLEEPIRISMTGCPNACGQHHICDIGLEGSVTSIDGIKRESFQVFLGGGVGSREAFGRRIGVRIPADELAESLARLLTWYRDTRGEGETFQEFCLRHNDACLVRHLAGSHPIDRFFHSSGELTDLQPSARLVAP
jgi:sulfite reductase beta subunit-like hemoprotein